MIGRIKILKQSLFTLLELLVVLFILSLVASVTLIKVKEAYQEQLFLAEAEQVLSHLQMAQDLMLILDTDVGFELTKYTDRTLSYRLDIQRPLAIKRSVEVENEETLDKAASLRWAGLIEREIPLKAIKSFVFEGGEFFTDSDQETHSVLEKIRLHFSLGKMSSGHLILSKMQDKHQIKENSGDAYRITLVGYPCSIRNQKKLINEADKIQESRKLYPKLNEG